jgi:hypothetical protein
MNEKMIHTSSRVNRIHEQARKRIITFGAEEDINEVWITTV